MKTKKRLQRFLSILLASIMVCSTPFSVLASSDIFVSDVMETEMIREAGDIIMSDETGYEEPVVVLSDDTISDDTISDDSVFGDEMTDDSEFQTGELTEAAGVVFSDGINLFSDSVEAENTLSAGTENEMEMDVQTMDAGIANGNVIDITDRVVYERSSWKSTVTNITIEGANVVRASEDGTTVDILLDSDTDSSAALKVTFGHTSKAVTFSQNLTNFTLENGAGTMTVTVSAKLTSSMSGSLTYTLNFNSLAPEGVTPERVQETDTIEAYEGQAVQFKLSKYFKYAQTYYLVDGETKKELQGDVFDLPNTNAGTYTYVIAAANESGMCEEFVTVTAIMKVHESGGFFIGATTSNGSLDAVKFTDADGNSIDGINVSIKGTNIQVVLPKTYPLTGKVTATFSRTANSSDYPFVTSSNESTGPSTALTNKKDVFTTTLSAGAGSATVYFYNSKPSATSNTYTTYTIKYVLANELPVLADGQSAQKEDTISAGNDYVVDVTTLFVDADEDELTYYVSVDGAEKVLVENPQEYVYNTNVAGAHPLVFTAYDGKGYSTDTYTVNLTVEDSQEMYTMTVCMPKDLSPEFYVGTDTTGKKLEAAESELPETETVQAEYQVKYPINAEKIFVTTEAWGGVAITTAENGSVILRQVIVEPVDFAEEAIEAEVTVTYDEDKTAIAGENGYLLAVGTEYVYRAAPKNASVYVEGTETAVLEDGTDVCTVKVGLGYKNPKTITVPTGATAQMFAYNKYYDFTEIEAAASVENEDDTTTFYFVTDKQNLSWRAAREGYVTEAGYWPYGNSIVVEFDNGANSSAPAGGVEDNSVLVNVNSQNNLVLSPGGSKLLKGYRAWEIIKLSYQNEIITPDFNFHILSGSDVISLAAADSPSNGGSGKDADWVTVTAENNGTAILEVTYDAIDVSGQNIHYPGFYNATDPTRTGLVVVQVGGHDSSVNFGIDCFASTGGLTYQASNARKWDAEFDTLYFLGNNGELKLSPTAASAILEVAVSNNKGGSWSALQNKDGVYTAPIISGNNIIRVTTESGVSYQVVRGKQVSHSVNVISGNEDGKIDAGETVRVILNGLHTPIPKMAGNYNPGYQANQDGDSSVHMVYSMNGSNVKGAGAQYNFATAANYIDVTIPEDYTESSISLEDGYIALGVIGLKDFTNGGNSHRDIPDNGCATRGSDTTFHTRSVLPEIEITIGGNVSPNTAPAVSENAMTEATVKFGYNYPINPEKLFTDAENDDLTYSVSVNGGEKTEVSAAYKFVPEAAGEYQLVFTANDGEYEVSHTVTITVTENEDLENELPFDIEPEEIEGYVSVGFEDFGVRVEGEKGLTYPVPLGTIIESTKVPYAKGDTIGAVTLRLLDALGIEYAYSGSVNSQFYFASLNKFVLDGTYYESMGEFDAGAGSGWMLTMNNWFINKGASDFEVSDGDLIKWKYTCRFGADIGCDVNKPSAEITGLNFKKNYGSLSEDFDPETESYVYTVPETVKNIALEAVQENYWAIATYTVDGKTYKPMSDIPVADGTEIVITCSYAASAGSDPIDTDQVKIIVKYGEPHFSCNWDEGEVTKEATCKTTGIRTYKCDCGRTKTEIVPKAAHKYGSWTTTAKATVFKPAVQKHTCSVCKTTASRYYGKKLTPVLEVPGKLKSFNIKVGTTRKFKITMANGDSISSVKLSNNKFLKRAFSKANGTVTLKGIKAGTTKVTITLKSGKKRTYTVKAVNGNVATTKLTVDNVTDKKLTLKKGKTFTVKTTKVPFTGTQKITYTTSNKNVVTVTSAGKVSAVKKGTAYITVKSGSKSVKIKVTVK